MVRLERKRISKCFSCGFTAAFIVNTSILLVSSEGGIASSLDDKRALDAKGTSLDPLNVTRDDENVKISPLRGAIHTRRKLIQRLSNKSQHLYNSTKHDRNGIFSIHNSISFYKNYGRRIYEGSKNEYISTDRDANLKLIKTTSVNISSEGYPAAVYYFPAIFSEKKSNRSYSNDDGKKTSVKVSLPLPNKRKKRGDVQVQANEAAKGKVQDNVFGYRTEPQHFLTPIDLSSFIKKLDRNKSNTKLINKTQSHALSEALNSNALSGSNDRPNKTQNKEYNIIKGNITKGLLYNSTFVSDKSIRNVTIHNNIISPINYDVVPNITRNIDDISREKNKEQILQNNKHLNSNDTEDFQYQNKIINKIGRVDLSKEVIISEKNISNAPITTDKLFEQRNLSTANEFGIRVFSLPLRNIKKDLYSLSLEKTNSSSVEIEDLESDKKKYTETADIPHETRTYLHNTSRDEYTRGCIVDCDAFDDMESSTVPFIAEVMSTPLESDVTKYLNKPNVESHGENYSYENYKQARNEITYFNKSTSATTVNDVNFEYLQSTATTLITNARDSDIKKIPLSLTEPTNYDKYNFSAAQSAVTLIQSQQALIEVTTLFDTHNSLERTEMKKPLYNISSYFKGEVEESLGLTALKLSVPGNASDSWPVKLSSVIEGDIILGGLMMVHSREDSVTCGPIMPQGGIQALEAMLYTLDQINTHPNFLPNFTIGAHILDDCDKDTYGLEMAVDFIKGK